MGQQDNQESRNNDLLTIAKLYGKVFRIPSYQRGYRWTRAHIEDLLNDLKEFMDGNRAEGDFYCLQPLVVAEGGGEYRVIDGQQRLTTLWLLLQCMGIDRIRIEYDRPTMLKCVRDLACTIDDAPSDRRKWLGYVDGKWREFANSSDLQNVELYHLFGAKLYITYWLSHNTLDTDFVNRVKVIWHLVPKEKEHETFRNMNSGKLPLTNAELIKALFLGSYGVNSQTSKINKAIMAEEFDLFEQTLRRPDFWYFLNSGGQQPASCIGFLFSIIQSIERPNAEDHRYRNYYFFRNQINNVDEANQAWAKVRSVFYTLEGWYDTPEIYNLVGYLSACGMSVTEIYRNYVSANSEEEFLAYLKYRCHEAVQWKAKETEAEQIEFLNSSYRYDKNKELTRRILLLMNVATLNLHHTSSNREGMKREISKFSFSDYHKCNWEVEHISPNNAVYRGGLERLHFNSSPTIGCKVKEMTDEHDRLIIDDYIASTDDTIMSLPNLTLLSKHINAAIGNEQFGEKRRDVIEKQSQGFYVLPCTMMVFAKAYLSPDDIEKENTEYKLNFWSDIDRRVYIKKINDTIARFFEGVEEKEFDADRRIQSTAMPIFEDDTPSDTVRKTVRNSGEASTLEQMTFGQLFAKYDYIIVPKIQRDYAQGRSENVDEKASTIRENLLNDIFTGGKTIDFQIIFGTSEHRRQIIGYDNEKKNVFIPIDGQQRLTTLFLLTLYQSRVSGTGLPPKFIYETRRAATDFCYAVSANPWVGFPNLKPSRAIRNSAWFMRYWTTDPTVDSMLRMLDAIHAKAAEHPWPDLDNIRFAFFDLGSHNISENIYLKMNSRGKDLTSFENLKADIEDNYKTLPAGWKSSMDGPWQDSFWTNTNPTQVPDMPLLRFIANTLYVLCLNELDPSSERPFIQPLYEVANKSLDDFIPSIIFIQAIDALGGESALQRLQKLLDLHAQRWPVSSVWRQDNPLLDENYSQRAVMYAMILSVERGATSATQLSAWLRFAWNIAENDIDSEESFIRVCRMFRQLSKIHGCEDILAALQNNDAAKLSQTAQYKEEIEKAKVGNNKDLFDAILSVERHRILKGAVRPLYAVGEESIWTDFIDKAKNLRELIPEYQEGRDTISSLVPYFAEDKLSKVFFHYYLSNEDDNIKSLLFQTKSKWVSIAQEMHDFLLRRKTNVAASLLGTQLADMAQLRLGWYYVRSGWIKDQLVLTDYERASGYYETESYVLANAVYNHLYNMLKEAGIVMSESKYPRGFYKDIIYKGATLRCYAMNNTIRVMCSEGHLGADEPGVNFVAVTKDTTGEDLLRQLDPLADYAAKIRLDLIKLFAEAMPCTLYGHKDDKDVPLDLTTDDIQDHQYVSTAVLCDGFSVCATISRMMNIEVGLRRLPTQDKKDKSPQKPIHSTDFNTHNKWWYYVKSFPKSKNDEAIKEINILLTQYVADESTK